MYEPKLIEPKWQKFWEDRKLFAAREDKVSESRPKYYCLSMFPYPSGRIHMGHVRNYTIGDVIARARRMQGFEVLQPIGWDAFGLPAENAAIQHDMHPEKWTLDNIAHMKTQLKAMGFAYDWSRELATCLPEYYRWNQWFFLKMLEKGLAYKKRSSVNWCPSCQTVLANEQVEQGKCWRCSSVVTQKDLEQWFFKITAYAERLLSGHEELVDGWPEEVLTMQRNWIGKSQGAFVDFTVQGRADKIRVFTTRPDTLFGATFLVLAPEHPLVSSLVTAAQKTSVQTYAEAAKRKTKIERTAEDKEKDGVFSGAHALNPVNGQAVPIWIADYVLADYGTGAIMAVPAHDQRDFDFAQKYKLPVVIVIDDPKHPHATPLEAAFEAEGVMTNSGAFNGQPSGQAKGKITAQLASQGSGEATTAFRLKDWLISRQRYWGTPIPAITCPDCGVVGVPEKDLPVLLPKGVRFTGTGESPLTQAAEFVNVKCPRCGKPAKRETDTMDTFVDSSWYYARYTDAQNKTAPFDPARANGWLSVDQYVGGIEHACMHLIYSRFFHKLFKDWGYVQTEEPFRRLLTQGMVTLGGSAMSKSRGNIVEPSGIIERYGADTARLFILFAAPPEKSLEWSDDGVQGAWTFLTRVWRLFENVQGKSGAADAPEENSKKLRRATHHTIKKVTQDFGKEFKFNTAIAAIMTLVNELTAYPSPGDAASRESVETLVLLLAPFAPHMAEELWQKLGKNGSITEAAWPKAKAEYLVVEEVEIVVQVNGKLRDRLSVDAGAPENAVQELALASPKVRSFTDGKKIVKTVYVPQKLVNIVVN